MGGDRRRGEREQRSARRFVRRGRLSLLATGSGHGLGRSSECFSGRLFGPPMRRFRNRDLRRFETSYWKHYFAPGRWSV